MTSRSRREINSSIVFAGVDGPVPHYGALDAICPETQFRLSHQSATGQGKLALRSGGDATVSDETDGTAPLTMKMILNEWPRSDDRKQPEGMKLGDYLNGFAGLQDDPYEIPPFITYRDAHQIFERASMESDNGQRAIEAVRLLVSDPWEEAVRLRGPGDFEPHVEYRGSGELTAHFRPGYFEETSASSGIMVSARPAFILRKGHNADAMSTQGQNGNETDRLRAMLAVTIQEGHYGVAAPGLRWDIRLALVWTRTMVSEENSPLKLAFHWRFHEHPHPFLLIEWSHEWRKFVLNIQSSPEERLERIAYAWIFYQAKWLDGDLKNVQNPLEIPKIVVDDWNSLLCVEPRSKESREGNSAKSQDWRTETLPLLARPEVGLLPELQMRLLSHVSEAIRRGEGREKLEWLKGQRRRLITDAIIAAGEEEGRRAEDAENSKRVESIVEKFENKHFEVHGGRSPWWMIVEGSSGSADEEQVL